MRLPSRINFLLFVILSMSIGCSPSKRSSSYSSSTSVAKGDLVVSKIIRTAKAAIGKKYKYGGNGNPGFDCSGLTTHSFLAGGYQLGRTTALQAKQGKQIALKQSRRGDLIFFTNSKSGGKLNHVALVVKNDQNGIWVIHSTTSRGVIEENVTNSSYWRPRIQQVRRIIP